MRTYLVSAVELLSHKSHNVTTEESTEQELVMLRTTLVAHVVRGAAEYKKGRETKRGKQTQSERQLVPLRYATHSAE